AGLEMLYAGATLEAVGGAARVAIACASARIEDAHGVVRELPAWQSATLHNGERVRVRTIGPTATAYLAIEGGFALAPSLGSRSTYTPAQLGGFAGRALRVGDVLSLRASAPTGCAERHIPSAPALPIPGTIRVLLGPQSDRFDPASIERFLNSTYSVTPASSRVGFRLEGPVLTHCDGYDLLSEGVVDGSIQVPGSGQPVILIADHPTVGGYPKIATAISADISAIGRLRIGGTVRFQAVDEASAAATRREERARFESAAASIRHDAS
ncbi:MAG TPA: biotin-dependent carboxyltransferase family protein, partial [Burkholderiales bacterium]|nr:biotin-dependent carboxyltransferase family protein [Burkholderiales bacterium]